MPSFQRISPPRTGDPARAGGSGLQIPDNPIVCYIDGDGIGREIAPRTRTIIDAAVEEIWGGAKRISWMKLYAGKEALPVYGELLPGDTLDAINCYRLCLKGPLETPVGSGHRSINVALRQQLKLYANVRPVSYIPGVPSPVRHPERVNMILFRENTEDLYAGIEWQQGSGEAREIIDLAARQLGAVIPEDAAIGIKVMSCRATKRIVRAAIDYARAHQRRNVTFVTKGNIMKYTEGSFRRWAYEVAQEEYASVTMREDELQDAVGETGAGERLLVRDRLADDMFQQVLLYPERYDVIVTPNLTGDYLADALSAQVGGVGIAPGANIGDQMGIFEATHGTAPGIAGKDAANPTGLILSAVLMLEYMGWDEAAQMVRRALEETIAAGQVTQDLARGQESGHVLSTTRFVQAVLSNI